jgi:hypothetical protein
MDGFVSKKQIIVVVLMLLGTSGLSQPLDDDDFGNNDEVVTPHRPTKPGKELENAPRKKRGRVEARGPDFGERLFPLPPGVDEAQWLAQLEAERAEEKRRREERDADWPTPLQELYEERMAEVNPLRDALRALAVRAAMNQNPCGIEVGELGFRMF